MTKGLEPLTRVAPALGMAGELLDTAYASLSAAVTAIGSTVSTLRIATPLFPNGATATVPSTLTLEFVGNGSLNITTGQTVTIQSDTSQWPIRKIFNNATAGLGEVLFTGNRRMDLIYPQWWGAIGDDSTDCAPAFQAMLRIVEYNGSINGARFFIPPGVYRIGTGLTYEGNFDHSFVMQGDTQGEATNFDGPVLKYTGSLGGTLLLMKGANWCNFEHIQFHANDLAKFCIAVRYDAGRSMSSFDCTWRHCTFQSVTGTDSMMMEWGDSNFASAEHRALDCRFVSNPGQAYYGIGTNGSANVKNHVIQRCRFGGMRWALSFSNSGYHKVDTCSFGAQTVADIKVSNAQVSVRDCGSEGSAKFIDRGGVSVTGSLLIEACYWHGATINDDFVIDYDGQLTLINNDFWNDKAETLKTFTVDSGTNVFTSTAHGFYEEMRVNVSSTGTLPAPLAAATNYYIRDIAANTFKLSATQGGTAIDITSTGSGTHSAFGPTEPAIKSGLGLTGSPIRGSVVSLNNSYQRRSGSPVMDFIPVYDGSSQNVSSAYVGSSHDGFSNPTAQRGLQLFSFGDKSKNIDGNVDINFPPHMPGHLTYVGAISTSAIQGKNLRGSATFSSAATATVTFQAAEPDDRYFISFSKNASEDIWWSSKANSGFTLNSSNPVSTATVEWHIVR